MVDLFSLMGAQWSFCFLTEEREAPGMKEEPLGSFASTHPANIIEPAMCQALFHSILGHVPWKSLGGSS